MPSDPGAQRASVAERQPSRRVGLVLTGGTIGAEFGRDNVVRLPTGAAAGRVVDAIEQWATAGGHGVELEISRPLNKLSENIVPADWVTLAQEIERIAAAGVDRFLVLHGTDTAAYTTAALSFLCAHLPVTICVTGSNLPPNQKGTDAPTNVTGSLTALLNLDAGVYLTFAGISDESTLVHLGTRVRKGVAAGRAFVSVNRSLVAEVLPGYRFRHVELYKQNPLPTGRRLGLDARVLLMRQFPGLDWSMLGACVNSERCRGVVIELYPSMTGPVGSGDHADVAKFVRETTRAGRFVGVTVSNAPEEFLNWYESAVELRGAGAVILGDMLPEVATVKLMWVLGNSGGQTEDVARAMSTPVAEELRRSTHGLGT